MTVAMTGLTTTASCLRCQWTAGPGDLAEVDKAAEAHTRKARHPTSTSARPEQAGAEQTQTRADRTP